MSTVDYQMEGDELVAYDNPFKNVTAEDAVAAENLENAILSVAGQISSGYLQIARALHEFKEKRYYIARGYETFRAWADSPNLKGIGYRTTHDLIRIYEEVLPILAKHDAMDVLPLVQSSKMRALLPVLGDEDGEEKIIEAVYAIQDLTTRDAYATIDEIRGRKNPFDENMETVFSARVKRGESFHKVTITAINGSDVYSCGTLLIKPKDWSRWEKRFGRFVEIAS